LKIYPKKGHDLKTSDTHGVKMPKIAASRKKAKYSGTRGRLVGIPKGIAYGNPRVYPSA